LFKVKNIDNAIDHLEEIALHKSLYLNKSYRTVRSHGLKAVLNGQGSDEVSLGYYNFYDFLHRGQKLLQYDNFLNYWQESFAFKEYMKEDTVRDLIDKNLRQNYLPYMGKDLLNSVLAFGVKTHLLNILNHEDRFSMAESIECRTVFTDYRIIEKMMSIPSRYKAYDGREKYLIRKVGEKVLPQRIINRKKTSFLPYSGRQEQILLDGIIADKALKNSSLLNQVFDKRLFINIHDLPLSQKWKIVNLYRFEKVFFS
jgi:asparagine synthase (glutamine-hydrolysing)